MILTFTLHAGLLHLLPTVKPSRVDLSRAEGRYRKSQEACSSTIAKAKDADKRLRKETEEKERVSAELEKLFQVAGILQVKRGTSRSN